MQQRVRDSEIAFGVLEVDRVHLVRHRRGAYLAGDRALAQVAEGDVTPRVAREGDENRVDAGERVAVFAYPVVRLDLRGIFVPGDALRLDECRADLPPVERRQRGDVRVEIADRAVPLAEDLDAFEAR